MAERSRRLSRWIVAAFVCSVIVIGLLFAFPQLRHGTKFIGLVFDTLPRQLPVPVAGVSRTSLADTWEAPRSGGRVHKGIDIFAKRNTPVLSATRGIVVRRRWNELGGNSISVMGPGASYHYYAHLEGYHRFGKGDWVEVGDTLGFVGTTGNARTTPPHLHYGIYRTSGAINPYPYLKPQRQISRAVR